MGLIDPATETAVNKIIQPIDRIRACTTVNEVARDAKGNVNPGGKRSRKYLAVIVNSRSEVDQALLVLFHRPATPSITALVPLYSDFQLSISQTNASSSSMIALDSNTPLKPDFLRARFIITLSSPSSDTPIVLLEDEISYLSEIIAEIKRLHALAIQHSFAYEANTSHEWVDNYVLTPANSTAPSLDSQTLAKFDSLASAYSKRGRQASLLPVTGAATWGNDDESERVREELVREQRARWVVEQLNEREDEFTLKENIKVFCSTYNINDKMPKPDDDLSPWIGDVGNAELLVVGFQEFDLSTEALWRYTPTREDAWRTELMKGLGEQAKDYVKICSRQLVGVLLIIFARKDCSQYVSKISASHLATGIMGLVANKGAVSIRLKYKETWLTFVNSHLAAFAGQVPARNQMVKDTEKYLVFTEGTTVKGLPVDPWVPNLRPEVEKTSATMTTVFDSHHLVWMGDLNYRIELPRADVLRMTEAKEWDMLLQFDQLKIQQKYKLAFAEFVEAPITFPPTFKFDIGTLTYDTSEKQRTPSWTDRIMWLSIKNEGVKCLEYKSCPEVTMSDHKPVTAMLQVEVSTVVKEKRMRVQHEVMTERELKSQAVRSRLIFHCTETPNLIVTVDQYDNDALPDVKLIPGPSIHFDRAIRYLIPQTQTVKIENVGSVVAQWFFTLKPGATTIAPPWLSISPSSGLLLPGERATVSFTIRVDNLTAPALNFGPRDELNDLLILSIEKKDLFLSVAAREYFPTCFACPLDRLARFSEGIRTYSTAQLKAIAAHDSAPFAEDRAKIPRPAGRMLDFLAEYALHVDEIFLVPGDPELVGEIRESLDEGDGFPLDKLFPMLETVISGTASMMHAGMIPDIHSTGGQESGNGLALQEIEEGIEEASEETSTPRFNTSPFANSPALDPGTPRTPALTQDVGPEEVVAGDRSSEEEEEEEKGEADDEVQEPVETDMEADIGALSLSPSIPSRLPAPKKPNATASPIVHATIKDDPRRASVARLSQTLRAKASDLGVLSMGDCFLRWCEALPNPIVPFGLYEDAVKAERREDAYALVERMPMIHSSMLLYIIAFLRVLVQQSTEESEREARLDRLAVVFSTVLLRPDATAPSSPGLSTIPLEAIPRRRKQFVLSLLQGEGFESLMGSKKAGFDDVRL
ncbi:BQ5605_C003g02070 [Microbotryum silenes-dioicae]|uniref:BQ5605_C003g02070 protein n=1 Tax=Microbotryum silenes-dioicae TaxID=796604 RepID=A0A2X0P380_9BASI|nr:BQ5605_C003g02070 [Microbotryum silenes-dioicae]